MSSVYISELDNISKQSQSIRNCFIDSAKMLRPTVHLFLLLLCYFALFDGIEADADAYADYDVNNIGWDPLERCEIELIEPSGRTTRFE